MVKKREHWGKKVPLSAPRQKLFITTGEFWMVLIYSFKRLFLVHIRLH